MTSTKMKKSASAAAGTRFTSRPAVFGRDFSLMEAQAGKELESWMINAVWSNEARSLWKALGGR